MIRPSSRRRAGGSRAPAPAAGVRPGRRFGWRTVPRGKSVSRGRSSPGSRRDAAPGSGEDAPFRECSSALARILVAFAALAVLVAPGCGSGGGAASGRESSREVVVYVSEDQVFSEPILRDFEQATGIRVRAVYDTEETKGTGVMNRLLAEAADPQADVYWANEPVRAELLRQRGLAAPYRSPSAEGIPAGFRAEDGSWTGFSARLRVLLVRADLADPPRSILALADPRWGSRAVIADPLFGTTAVHAAALFAAWGDERARDFFERVKRAGVALSTSNGESADLVARGKYDWTLVDSDDAVARVRRGEPVRMIVPDQEEGGLGCLVLPNAAVLIRGGPHPEEGRRLVDWLLSRETEEKLARADCAQVPLHPGVPVPEGVPRIEDVRPMRVSLPALGRTLDEIQPFLGEWAGH